MKLAVGNAIGVPFRAGFVSKYMALNLPLISGLDSYFPTVKINEFDGVDDYVEISDSDSLDVTTKFTMILWAKQNSYVLGAGLLDKYITTTGSRSYRLYTTDDEMTVVISSDGSNSGTSTSGNNCGFTNNEETFIAITYNAGNITYYKNGIPCDTDINARTSIHSSTTNLNIGKRQADNKLFNGEIYETAMLNEDLDATTILDIYNAGKNNYDYGTLTGVVMHNNLTSASYGLNQVKDLSGQGNHGTSYGKGEFSRSTNGTFTDHNGVIQTAGIDIARHEGQRWINDDKGGSEYIGENAMVFDGNDYINIGDNIDVGTDDFTLMCWCKPNQIGDVGYLISKEDADPRFYMRYNGDGGILSVIDDGTNTDVLDTTTAIGLNKWSFICLSIDRDGLSSIYINGVLNNSQSTTATLTLDNSNNFIIGGSDKGTTERFQGLIDNPIIIKGIALTGEEVFQQYQYKKKGLNYLVRPENVVSAYKLDDTTSTIIDYVGSNNGTFYSSGVEATPTLTEGVYDSDTRIPSDTLKGLMSYEGATNLLTYSEDFSNVAWSKADGATITANQTISPDGTLTADLIDISDISGDARVAYNISGLTIGEEYTFSFYAKSVTGTGTYAISILNSSQDTSIINLTEEWTRYTKTVTSVGTQLVLYIGNERDATGTLKQAYIWGAQLEESSFATPYIETTSTTASTTDDNHKQDVTDIPNFTQGKGSLYAEFNCDGNNDNYPVVCALTDKTSDNSIELHIRPTSNILVLRIVDSGVQNTYIEESTAEILFNIQNKVGITYEDNNVKLFLNGIKIGEDTVATIPTGLTTLYSGNKNGSKQLNGTIKDVKYYNEVLTEAQAINMTK